MDTFRYAVAVAIMVSAPAAILYWFSIHPLIRFWRRLGLIPTLVINYSLIIAIALCLWMLRHTLLAVEYGFQPSLALTGVVLLAVAVWLRILIRRQLENRTLQGMPEIDPEHHPVPLLREGIYARLRHPRYVQVLIALWGWAVLANYLAGYLIAAGATILVPFIALLEERELRARFGSAYDDYAARVPRFIPRIRSAG